MHQVENLAHLIAFDGASDIQLALILLGSGQQLSSGSFRLDTPLAAAIHMMGEALPSCPGIKQRYAHSLGHFLASTDLPQQPPL